LISVLSPFFLLFLFPNFFLLFFLFLGKPLFLLFILFVLLFVCLLLFRVGYCSFLLGSILQFLLCALFGFFWDGFV